MPTDLIQIKMIKRKEMITCNEIPSCRDVFRKHNLCPHFPTCKRFKMLEGSAWPVLLQCCRRDEIQLFKKQILLTSSKHCVLAPRAQQLAAAGLRDLEGCRGDCAPSSFSLFLSQAAGAALQSASEWHSQWGLDCHRGEQSPHPDNADAEPNRWTIAFCVQVSAMKWIS